MTIKIERHIRTVDYAHYPGQILVDHPDAVGMVEQGYAVPVVETPEITAELPAEIADPSSAEEAATAPAPETRKRNRKA